MNVQLKKPELDRYIDEQVKAGHFPTPEAVVEDALTRMMEEDVALSDEDAEAFSRSDAEIDAGDSVEFEEFAARARRKYGIK